MKKEKLQLFYIKYKLIIYPLFVAFASIVLIALVIYPQIKGYFSGQEDKRATNERITKLEAKAKELEAVPDEDLRKQVQFSVLALPSEKDFTSIIGLLQRLSAESGVNLVSVTLNTAKGREIGGATSFSVKTEIASSRGGFDELLSKIENTSVILRVVSMTIDSGLAADSLTGSIVIDVFYSPVPKSLGNIDSPLVKLTQEEEALAVKLAGNIVLTPVTPGTQDQIPVNLPPRGKANPFE